ncbi:MAG TPA: tetratricopeptide repeat protein [Actinomycetota bacterium]|nr:tetratricopeptide repeat protein [Actinomycetota bacterium]
MSTQPNPNVALRGAVDLGALAAAREAEQQAAARRADPTAARVIIDVTEASFESDVIAASQSVPVVVDLWATWCGPCKQLSPVLEKLAVEYAGRWVLAKVDVDAQPQIGAAFRVQSIPTIVAVIKGQVLPLFQGALPEPQVRQYLEELLRVAAEAGVGGSVGPATADDSQAAPEDPRWDEAADAVEAGDWDTATALYEQLRVVDPEQAQAALAQVALVRRTLGVDADEAVAAADADPLDLAKARVAADVEVAQGQAQAAFDRILVIVRATAGQDRVAARDALVELFALVGDADPAVIAARSKLANALF